MTTIATTKNAYPPHHDEPPPTSVGCGCAIIATGITVDVLVAMGAVVTCPGKNIVGIKKSSMAHRYNTVGPRSGPPVRCAAREDFLPPPSQLGVEFFLLVIHSVLFCFGWVE